MKQLASVVSLVSFLAGCATDAPPSGQMPITGSIDHDQTWSGIVDLKGFVTIEPGVTVTIESGTTVRVASAASVTIDGTLIADGTKAEPITIEPSDAGEHWLGFNVSGTLTMHYTTQLGGPLATTAGSARVTVADSVLAGTFGDFVIVDGGTVDIQYTVLGKEAGDSTHCNLHINKVTSLTFTHNTNAGVAYGLMLYGGHGDFTHNNWVGNVYDIEPAPAGTGAFDGSYFAKGEPAGVAGSTFANLSATPLTDVGPR